MCTRRSVLQGTDLWRVEAQFEFRMLAVLPDKRCVRIMCVFHSSRCDVRFDASPPGFFDTAVPAAVIKKGRERVLGSSAQKPAHATSGDDDLHTFNHNRRAADGTGQGRQMHYVTIRLALQVNLT